GVAAAGIGRDDLHLAPGCLPAVAAELACARARRVVLAEDAQARDAVDERELRDHADRAERPGRRVAGYARREARLDALADVQRVADGVELHGGAVDDAQHAAARLPALGRGRDALDRRDLVVVD